MIKKISSETFHEFLENKIVTHNAPFVSRNTENKSAKKMCYAYEDNTEYLAGMSLEYYWGMMHINYLWVDEKLRGKKIGEKFIEIATKLAIEEKCTIIYLETFSFQAPNFYKKYDFKEFAKLENVPEEGIQLYFMKKLL